jgi:membrane-bound lytic murein transglycosylase MltF
MWTQILPRLKLNQQAVLRSGGRIGWALRKSSPGLGAEVLAYLKARVTKGVIASRMNWYLERARRLRNPTEATERTRFQNLLALFEKYGQRYHFDPLMLAAQGYQESRLNQDARSHVGAIGIMQIMPQTGAQLKVGDIRITEPNIHAGAKYMDQLMTMYFADAEFDETNRTLFAFASYNAGPVNIAKMRNLAAKGGLDPNQWFNHVEIVTAQRIGLETTTYVRNIYKYYVAYKLMTEAHAAEQTARQQLNPPRAP